MSSVLTSSEPAEKKRLLRQPDEFVRRMRPFFARVASSPSMILICLGVIITSLVAVAAYMHWRAQKTESAKDALFLAHQSLSTEIEALEKELKPLSPPKKDGDPSQEPEEFDEGVAAFALVDVDTKFAKSLTELKNVASAFAGTRAAFEAKLTIANLYADHGAPAPASDWYTQAFAGALTPFEKSSIQHLKGIALENQGKHEEALLSYQDALAIGYAALKSEIELAIARTQVLLGRTGDAQQTYDRIISEHPNTPNARTAEILRPR